MKITVQIFLGSFAEKVISTIPNINARYFCPNLPNFLKGLQTSIRLKPTDPIYDIKLIKIKVGSSFVLLDDENFDEIMAKVAGAKGKVYVKALVSTEKPFKPLEKSKEPLPTLADISSTHPSSVSGRGAATRSRRSSLTSVSALSSMEDASDMSHMKTSTRRRSIHSISTASTTSTAKVSVSSAVKLKVSSSRRTNSGEVSSGSVADISLTHRPRRRSSLSTTATSSTTTIAASKASNTASRRRSVAGSVFSCDNLKSSPRPSSMETDCTTVSSLFQERDSCGEEGDCKAPSATPSRPLRFHRGKKNAISGGGLLPPVSGDMEDVDERASPGSRDMGEEQVVGCNKRRRELSADSGPEVGKRNAAAHRSEDVNGRRGCDGGEASGGDGGTAANTDHCNKKIRAENGAYT